MRPPPGGRLLLTVMWIAAMAVLSGPTVFFVQTVLRFTTGRWPDWTAWGIPLGYVLIAATLLGALALVLAFGHINRFLQRRHDRRRLSGQART
jgi:uncharacterized integral membrane protein